MIRQGIICQPVNAEKGIIIYQIKILVKFVNIPVKPVLQILIVLHAQEITNYQSQTVLNVILPISMKDSPVNPVLPNVTNALTPMNVSHALMKQE